MYKETIGFRHFHDDPNFNFQFNRWLPFLPEEAVKDIAQKISSFETWETVLLELARASESDGALSHAAFYFRAAEFYMPHERAETLKIYDNFQRLFDAAEKDFEFRREQVPFEGQHLPAFIVEPEGPLVDTLVVHGGFDSFAEELLPQIIPIAKAGVRLILFEGPGQGHCLNKLSMPMTPNWELPVGAVLDHFDLDTCSLLGISLGGCLALRAAAFEPRIKRVIADDILENFFGCLAHRMGAEKARALDFMLRFNLKSVLNRAMNKARNADPSVDWAVGHGLRVSGCDTPFDYLMWAKKMTTRDISHLVKQDCLLLAAKDDHLVPIQQFYKQVETLTNVRSLTCRVLTEEEHASQHCHVGNMGLANHVISDWLLERVSAAEMAIEA